VEFDLGKVHKERRSKRRFVIELDIRYKVLYRDEIKAAGSGKTVNLSSAGVAFKTEHDLPIGATMRLSITWPALLDNRCQLQLVGSGRITRSAAGTVACKIHKYELRTLARLVAETGLQKNRRDSDQLIREFLRKRE
jgi:hypothetical protein